MWRREFGSDLAIAGKTLTLRGLPYSIAGVARFSASPGGPARPRTVTG